MKIILGIILENNIGLQILSCFILLYQEVVLFYQGNYFGNNTAYQIFLCTLNCTILENSFHCKFTCHVNIKISKKIFAESMTRVSPAFSLVVLIDYR